MTARTTGIDVLATRLREAEESARDAEQLAAYAPSPAARRAAESDRSYYEGLANRIRHELARCRATPAQGSGS